MRLASVMQIHVKVPSPAMARRIEQLTRFYLTGLISETGDVRISLESVHDRLGSLLCRCRVAAVGIVVEETQGDPVLATTRALDRTVRTLRRGRVPGQFLRTL